MHLEANRCELNGVHMNPLQPQLQKNNQEQKERCPKRELTEPNPTKNFKRSQNVTQWCRGQSFPKTLLLLLLCLLALPCHASHVCQRVGFVAVENATNTSVFTGPFGPPGRFRSADAMASAGDEMRQCDSCATSNGNQLGYLLRLLQEMRIGEGMGDMIGHVLQWVLCSGWMTVVWLWNQTGYFSFSRKKRKRDWVCKHATFSADKRWKKQRRFGLCRFVGRKRVRVRNLKYRRKAHALRVKMWKIKQTQMHRHVHTHEQSANNCETTKRPSICGSILCHFVGFEGAKFVKAWWAGKSSATLLKPLKCLFQWDPFSAVRVGEASNPGPGGRYGARKRSQNDDQGLAEQLMSVLQSFRNQTSHQTKRVKTSQGSHQNQGLAHVLINMLQSAIHEKWQDSDIADTLIETLQPYVAYDNGDTKSARPVGNTWEGSNMYYEQNNGSKRWSKHNVGQNWQNKDEWNNSTVTVSRWRAKPEPSKAAKQGDGQENQTVSHTWKGPRCAEKVQVLEWTTRPILTTVNQIKKNLEAGKTFDANLVVTKDPEATTEIQHLWNAYAVNQSLTVATVATDKVSSDTHVISVWWDSRKTQTHKPHRTKVTLWQATSTKGPVPVKGQTIELEIKDTPKLTTVRVLAPGHYRKLVPGVEGPDNPQSVICEWAQLVACRAALLCGGNWQDVQHKHSRFVIGHLRLPNDLAEKSVSVSGKRGLFFTIVGKETKASVGWLLRSKDTTAEEYYKTAIAQATETALPLVLRQGGQSDLGIAGVTVSELNHPRHFEVFGAPNYWGAEEIQVFLGKTQWKQAEVIARVRRGRDRAWLFKALPAPFQNDDQHGQFWQFCNTEGKCTFTIIPQQKGRMRHAPMEWLKPPRPNKHLLSHQNRDHRVQGHGETSQQPPQGLGPEATGPREEVPPTVPDTPSQTASQQSQIDQHEEGRRQRSPRRGPKASGSGGSRSSRGDPKDEFLSEYGGWTTVDCQGDGDCAFRSIAQAIGFNQNKTFDNAHLQREASKLRVLAVGHLIKNKDVFHDQWEPDPEIKASHCANQDIPVDFSDYCMSASKAGFWADTMLLNAIMERLGTVIVIFKWIHAEKVWKRTVLAKKFKEDVAEISAKGVPPLALMLINDHYWFLKPPDLETAFPQAWLSRTPIRNRGFLRGAGRSVPALSLPSTPSQKNVKTVKKTIHKKSASVELSLPSHTPSRRSSQTKVQRKYNQASETSLQLPVNTPSQKVGSVIRKGKNGSDSHVSHDLCSHANQFQPLQRSNKRPRNVKDSVSLAPEVQERMKNHEVVVWWTCPHCQYKVFHQSTISDSRAHVSRKWHLKKTHGINCSKTPTPEQSHRIGKTETQKHATVQKAQCFTRIVQESAWNGSHIPQYFQKPKGTSSYWKCTACDKRMNWSEFPESTCSNSRKSRQTNLNLSRKKTLWMDWWQQAITQWNTDVLTKVKLVKETQWLQDQHRLHLHSAEPKPAKFGGIPAVPSAPLSENSVWWTCSFCDFQVQNTKYGKHHKRLKHLTTAHGMSKDDAYLFRSAINHPQRSASLQTTVLKRWECQLQEFQKVKWVGAHDILPNPVTVKLSHSNNGRTYQCPLYRCQGCQRLVPSSAIPTSICLASSSSGKVPSEKFRKATWIRCREAATVTTTNWGSSTRRLRKKQATKKKQKLPKEVQHKGTVSSASKRGLGPKSHLSSPLSRGLRGVRVGEASHPGPVGGLDNIKFWSQNIRSFTLHGKALLHRAAESQVHLVAVQETNLGEQSLPSISHRCMQQGWQMMAIPTHRGSKNRGGVAILCRQPLTMVEVSKSSSSNGQTLEVEVFGGQTNFRVFCHYRHADDQDMLTLHEIQQKVQVLQEGSWVLALDANANQSDGPCPDIFLSVGGVCRATAGHLRSSYPIDAIWTSHSLQPAHTQSNIAGDGDHTIAQVTLNIKAQKPQKQQFRFSRVRRRESILSVIPDVEWHELAISADEWKNLLTDPSKAWSTWSQDVEKWLTFNGYLEQTPGERPLGSAPSLRTSTHYMAPCQDIQERQIRRWIRQLVEAQTVTRLGRAISPALSWKLSNAQVPAAEKQAVSQSAWGLAHSLANERLHAHMRAKQNEKLSHWKNQVSQYAGACQWVRLEGARPVVVKTAVDTVLTSRVQVVQQLKDTWANIFGTQDGTQVWRDFHESFHQFFPLPQAPPQLAKITATEVQKIARKMVHKADGLDGIAAASIVALPPPALERLCDLFEVFEQTEEWPAPLRHWRLTFLPKASAPGQIPTADQLRPISIAPVVYRIWSAIRLQHLRGFLSNFLVANQAGYNGPSVQDLLLSFDLEFHSSAYPYVAALDFSKAFDSTDWYTCTQLLTHIGAPRPVVALLANQWGQRTKWVSAGGAVFEQALTSLQCIPQGDAWSPVAMSLLLAVAVTRVQTLVPCCRHLMYIDDRTVLAPSRTVLLQALQAWETFYSVTRLKNNQQKEQLLTRTPEAFAEMMMNGHDVSCQATILGVSFGMVPRAMTAHEKKRLISIGNKARRIAVLPSSHHLKTAVASTVLSPARAWGVVFNGKIPTIKENSHFQQCHRMAIKGWYHKGGHDSRQLWSIFQAGHTSDLTFFASLKFIKALHKWIHNHPGFSLVPHRPSISALIKGLKRFGSQWNDQGKVIFHHGTWNLTQPVAFGQQWAHLMRQSWRKWQFQSWLDSQRVDAKCAREQGICFSDDLLASLRNAASSATGHEVAILAGGVQTDAHWCSLTDDRKGLRDLCHDCSQNVTPSTCHVLWECPKWNEFRQIPKPDNPFLARMAWKQSGVHRGLMQQLALIRKAHVRERNKRSTSGVAGGDRGGGPSPA